MELKWHKLENECKQTLILILVCAVIFTDKRKRSEECIRYVPPSI